MGGGAPVSRRLLDPAADGVHLCLESNAWSRRFEGPAEEVEDAEAADGVAAALGAAMALWQPDAVAVTWRQLGEYGFEGDPVVQAVGRPAAVNGPMAEAGIAAWVHSFASPRDGRSAALIESLHGGWLRVALPAGVHAPHWFSLRNTDGLLGAAASCPGDDVGELGTVWIRLDLPEPGFILAMSTPDAGELTLRSPLTLFEPSSDVRPTATVVLGAPLEAWFEANKRLCIVAASAIESAFMRR